MKRILLILLINTMSFGQISITNVANEKPKIIESYDGSKNFLGEDFMGYKGQELYFKPIFESLRKYGNSDFLDENKKQLFNLEYEFLAEKYFLVEDVIEPLNGNKQVLFKLKNKSSNEILFFKYDPKYKSKFPFLVVKYYETQKELFVNKEILIRDFPKLVNSNQKKILDIDSGEEIVIDKGQYLKCIDLTIDKKYFDLSLLLQNNKGQKFTFPLYARDLNIKRILTKEEAEKFRLKFGDENWKIILNQNVKVGFTEKMAEISMGMPIKINRSSSGDQWVYDGNYLYFLNGKLTSFN
jgi:hypothetical protein